MDLAVTDARLELLRQDGLHALTSLAAPNGLYAGREVVREAAGNLLSSTTKSLQQ